MFCPECRSEYQEGYTRCTECDVALVQGLQPNIVEADAQDEPVTVFNAINGSEASLVKSLLEGSGLEPMMFDANFSYIDPPAALIIGGIKLTVPRSQEKLALEVLEEYRGRAGQDPAVGNLVSTSITGPQLVTTGDAEEEYRCPRCVALLAPETTVCPTCGARPF
jgi:hypothetical protein